MTTRILLLPPLLWQLGRRCHLPPPPKRSAQERDQGPGQDPLLGYAAETPEDQRDLESPVSLADLVTLADLFLKDMDIQATTMREVTEKTETVATILSMAPTGATRPATV